MTKTEKFLGKRRHEELVKLIDAELNILTETFTKKIEEISEITFSKKVATAKEIEKGVPDIASLFKIAQKIAKNEKELFYISTVLNKNIEEPKTAFIDSLKMYFNIRGIEYAYDKFLGLKGTEKLLNELDITTEKDDKQS